MFCSPWDCPCKAPDRPFVFRLADGRPLKKLPTQPMHSSKSRSEPKTRANMPSLRQLEFAFDQFTIRVVEAHGAAVGQALRLPPRHTVAESLWDASRFAQRSAYKASDLEATARQLLCSLGAKRITTELRVEWNSRLQTAA